VSLFAFSYTILLRSVDTTGLMNVAMIGKKATDNWVYSKALSEHKSLMHLSNWGWISL